MVYETGAWIDGKDLQPGDQFRAIGPVQTVGKEGVDAYGMVTTLKGNYHHTDKGDAELNTRFVLVKKAVQYPEFWPPRNGDVWRSPNMGDEYFVAGDRIYNGRSNLPVSELKKTVENGNRYFLVHRAGRKLGNLS